MNSNTDSANVWTLTAPDYREGSYGDWHTVAVDSEQAAHEIAGELNAGMYTITDPNGKQTDWESTGRERWSAGESRAAFTVRALTFPDATGETITQGHADYCTAHGHGAPHSRRRGRPLVSVLRRQYRVTCTHNNKRF